MLRISIHLIHIYIFFPFFLLILYIGFNRDSQRKIVCYSSRAFRLNNLKLQGITRFLLKNIEDKKKKEKII